jgi:adhesin transport system membrane fusion protein
MAGRVTRTPKRPLVEVKLSAARLVPPPTTPRRLAGTLVAAFAVFVAIVVFSPWQQNISGTGRIIAFTPLERQQNIEAPVGGRVVRWFVQEGDQVSAGDPIVEVSDNDPAFLERLRFQRDMVAEQLRQAEARVVTLNAQLEQVRNARRSALRAADAQIRAARQNLESRLQAEQAARATLDTALLNLGRNRELSDEGLVSQRQRELAELDEQRSRTGYESARAMVEESRSQLAQRQADKDRTDATTQAQIEAAVASVQAAESAVAAGRGRLTQLDVDVTRQETQLIEAPRDGTIFRLTVREGAEMVSSGQSLAILVPTTRSRAVELWVDGNDASLIGVGRHVRLQFEGWPAVQFTGWPSVAVGTFGGEVAFVDAADDGRGDFRVVVVPDPNDEPWPHPQYLRQGVRANGWVLLDVVSVGFEIWRQLNGFPPVVEPPSSADDYAADMGSEPPN